ncbi:MAG TPA: metallophosphoesterase family protein [Candidatus Hydrogenedentes bacterium]|nr:metallophosphoesterase family protein [Candidatus Hydrogenedentota bacterium]
MIKKLSSLFHFVLFAVILFLSSGGWTAEATVDEVMNGLVNRLYATFSPDDLCALDNARLETIITPKEREVLATKHWYFDVDVPVVVSVLRNVDQKTIPFWLAESGFKKTDLVVKNVENWTYEVWQKSFPPGQVGLGINGFENFRPHYLVCVGPQTPGAKVTLSGFYPEGQTVEEMKDGAMTYLDWTELVLKDVPESLKGQQFLHTIRGRARETALVEGSFRKTPFPSSEKPEPVFLTWSEDPRTTQTIQWRTSTSVPDGVAQYRKKRSNDKFERINATALVMEDRMLANDRRCKWFTAQVQGLNSGTTYEYQVGSPSKHQWSEVSEFTTAPSKSKGFRFFYCSDTHSHKDWGDLLAATFERYPKTAFCTVSGDLVGTGMEREDWDMFLTYGEPMFRMRPIMPAIGNHDAQLGLGPGMYLDIFNLPENGPKGIRPERAYTFHYSNAQFFILDVMSDTQLQKTWLREELAKSDATWKFAVFHFPIYSQELEYEELKKEWGDVFDEYHMDFVLTGHVHNHLRTYSMHAGKRVGSISEGTVYITSVSIPSDALHEPKPDFVEAWAGGGGFCNIFEVDGKHVSFQAMTADGAVKDEFKVKK